MNQDTLTLQFHLDSEGAGGSGVSDVPEHLVDSFIFIIFFLNKRAERGCTASQRGQQVIIKVHCCLLKTLFMTDFVPAPFTFQPITSPSY